MAVVADLGLAEPELLEISDLLADPAEIRSVSSHGTGSAAPVGHMSTVVSEGQWRAWTVGSVKPTAKTVR